MSGINETGKVTLLPDEAIPLYARVRRTSTGVALADANDPTYGSALEPGFIPDTDRDNYQAKISVKVWNASGQHFAIASAAIAAGAEFQGAADGEIAPLAGGKAIGVAHEAAAGDQHVIAVDYYPPETGEDVLETFADPGDAGDIDVTGNSYVEIVTAGAETRTIGDPVAGGQLLTITMKTDGGNAVVTADSAVNVTGNNTLTFADAGDTITLVSIADGASAFRWSVLGNDGVALSTV